MKSGKHTGVDEAALIVYRCHQDAGQVDVLRELVRHKDVESEFNFLAVFHQNLNLLVDSKALLAQRLTVLLACVISDIRKVLQNLVHKKHKVWFRGLRLFGQIFRLS